MLVTFWLYVFFASASLAAESAVVEGAKKEGALVFYTTMDIQNSKPLLDAFMKKYPFIKGDLVLWFARGWRPALWVFPPIRIPVT